MNILTKFNILLILVLMENGKIIRTFFFLNAYETGNSNIHIFQMLDHKRAYSEKTGWNVK